MLAMMSIGFRLSGNFYPTTPTGCHDYRNMLMRESKPRRGETNKVLLNRTIQTDIFHHMLLQISLENSGIPV